MNGENKMQLKTGKIVQITGPVVDVKFVKEALPKIKEKLYVEKNNRHRTMEVVQHIGHSTVRCVMLGASEGLCRDIRNGHTDYRACWRGGARTTF